MTEYERYIFDGECPYTGEKCEKDCLPCAECEINEQEKEYMNEEGNE